jgi:hypothetical protein
MEYWSWGPQLWASGLSIGTVEGTEARDSGDDSLVLEGVCPRHKKRSVMVLDMGLCAWVLFAAGASVRAEGSGIWLLMWKGVNELGAPGCKPGVSVNHATGLSIYSDQLRIARGGFALFPASAAAVVAASAAAAAADAAAAAAAAAVLVASSFVAAAAAAAAVFVDASSASPEDSMSKVMGVCFPPPPRTIRRSSWAKLVLRPVTLSPSKPVAPADLEGSCECCLIFVRLHSPWQLRERTNRSNWTLPLVVPGLMLHWLGGHCSCKIPSAVRAMMTSSH